LFLTLGIYTTEGIKINQSINRLINIAVVLNKVTVRYYIVTKIPQVVGADFRTASNLTGIWKNHCKCTWLFLICDIQLHRGSAVSCLMKYGS